MARTPTKKKKRKGGKAGRIAFAVLVSLAVLALAFFLVLRDQGKTSIAENALGSVLTPVQNAVSTATRYVRDVIQGVKDYRQMSLDLEEAKLKIADLELQVGAMTEAAQRYEQLNQQLEAKKQDEALDPLFAKVVARDPGVWFDTFTIDRGTVDGVAVNMAVVSNGALVGRTYEVGLNYAKVLSIIDTRSAVSCLIQRTRDNGVLRGELADGNTVVQCKMSYLPAVNDVMPGDVVITSGVDTLYPKGIEVGTVTSISRQTDNSDNFVMVSPSVDFLHIEEVLVLRVVAEEQEALPVLPTNTPRPTPEPTPSVEPSLDPNATPTLAPDDGIFSYPTPLPPDALPGAEESPQPSAEPTPEQTAQPTLAPEGLLPEDDWALE